MRPDAKRGSVERISGAQPHLVVSGLHKKFGDKQVLRGIDLSIPAGEVVCLLGPSGCGKSTLLRCINALETPTSGSISVGDRFAAPAPGTRWTFNRSRERELSGFRSRIGMVFQQFNLWPHMTVLQNVIEGPRQVKKLPYDDAAVIGETLLSRVGLAGRGSEWPMRLSGGEKQRVAIARALAMEPQLLLMDEPTSALDPELTGEVLDVIQSLAKDGTTMLIATHEVAFARSTADRIIFMDNGVVVEEGAPEQFFTAPRTDRAARFLSRIMRDFKPRNIDRADDLAFAVDLDTY